MKNSIDTIENLNRNLPACSAVPQPTAHREPPKSSGRRLICHPTFRILFCSSSDITRSLLALSKFRTDPKKPRLVNKRKYIPVSPMGTYGEPVVYVHEFLTSAISGGDWSASRHGRFVPEKIPTVSTEPEAGWSLRASMDALEKRISCPLLGIEP